jgi:hypothetical protein
MMNDDDDTVGPMDQPTGPDDATLLATIGRLWQQVDPPPADLAHGVLARLAAEDLEFDLLILVESEDALAGVRSAAESSEDAVSDTEGSWALEYAHPDFRVYLRLNRIEDRTRLDGWVVPARPLTVRLLAEEQELPLETSADEFGRFEFAMAPRGLARVLFLDVDHTTAQRPRITPPFWI